MISASLSLRLNSNGFKIKVAYFHLTKFYIPPSVFCNYGTGVKMISVNGNDAGVPDVAGSAAILRKETP